MKPIRYTSIRNNPSLSGFASWMRDITYSTETGTNLTLQLLLPWAATDPAFADQRWPLVVFVQGSAWTFPDVGYELPQLGSLARKGYIVASVTHRSSLDGHKAPAFLQDVKTAIRFLRKNADTYRIDPERVAIWGTSSGGNTALLVGLTGDDPFYRTTEHAGVSDAVKTVVECFGPSDLLPLFGNGIPETDENGNPSIFIALLGHTGEEQLERLAMMDPIRKVIPGRTYPPFMMLHGDADPVVAYEQSEKMAQLLSENDVHTELVRVEGAPHERDFWSLELVELVEDFLSRTL
jgi:acetyl esterase/lipase